MSTISTYRAWHKGNKYDETSPEMFYSSTKNNTFVLRDDGSWDLGVASYEWEVYGASSYNGDVLMQSTGIFTKDKQEIFEGDVLKNKEFLYKVVYENGSFVCYHLNEKDWEGSPRKWGLLSRIYDADMRDIYNDLQIIGNVHDNPPTTPMIIQP